MGAAWTRSSEGDSHASRVGKALLSRVAETADDGYRGIMLNVLNWNHAALQFFQGAGASILTARKTLCLTGGALRRAASGESVAGSWRQMVSVTRAQ